MITRDKIRNFFSIYGPIIAGLFFVFIGSVTSQPVTQTVYHPFPVAGFRAEKGIGGDIAPAVFPVAQHTFPLLKNTSSTFTGSLTAAAALVVDDTSNAVLFDKNSKEVRPLASISKLMSALVLMDLPVTWASTTVITSDDWDGSGLVTVGEKYTLEDLWQVGLVGSSNTAINALARNSTATTSQFIALMNKKAADLRLDTASFVEPTGLSSLNVASAEDAAALLKEAIRRDKIYKALHTPEYYSTPLNPGAKQHRVWSTDWLLTRWIPSDYGLDSIVGKTGYIEDSLYNFAVRLTNDRGHSLRIVILGAATNEARFTEARDLADWVFKNYLWPNDPGYQSLTE